MNVPLWLQRVLFYGTLLVWLTLLLVLSPFVVLYWCFLCWRVSREWRRMGKDVLTVLADSPSCERRMQQILPLVNSRSEFLNWSKREMWKRWSIGPQVFGFYFFLGPQPFRLKYCLPVVFVFRRFYWPTTFHSVGHRRPKRKSSTSSNRNWKQARNPTTPTSPRNYRKEGILPIYF